jgi:hypothetical protein
LWDSGYVFLDVFKEWLHVLKKDIPGHLYLKEAAKNSKCKKKDGDLLETYLKCIKLTDTS